MEENKKPLGALVTLGAAIGGIACICGNIVIILFALSLITYFLRPVIRSMFKVIKRRKSKSHHIDDSFEDFDDFDEE